MKKLYSFIRLLKDEYILIVAVIIGIIPRTYHLSGQILSGDEWHAIHNALYNDYRTIISSLGVGSLSIPDSVYYKVMMDTVGLSEMEIRLPPLIFGVLTIIILPLLVRPLWGRFTSNLFAYLLALSPMLILYSRYSRPYSAMVLFGFASVTLFHHWWYFRSRKAFFFYVILSSLCAYYMIISIPFIVSPFLYFLVVSHIGKTENRRDSLERIFRIGIATFLSLILLLGFPLYTSFHNLTRLAADQSSAITIETILSSLSIFTGKDSLLVTICLVFCILAGFFRNYRNSNYYFVYLLFLSAIQIVFIISIRPVAGHGPHIFARYILLILPVLLLMAAAGVKSLFAFLNGFNWDWLRPWIAAVLCFLLFCNGPIPSMRFQPNNAMELSLFSYMLFGRDYRYCLKYLKRIPDFYKQLGIHPPGSLNIVEVPFHINGYHIPFYQIIHRQNFKYGFINGLCSGNREGEIPIDRTDVHFSNFVFLKNFNLLRDYGAHYVIFHKYLEDEVVYTPEHKHQDVFGCIEQYQREFGSPVFEDRDIEVFLINKPVIGR